MAGIVDAGIVEQGKGGVRVAHAEKLVGDVGALGRRRRIEREAALPFDYGLFQPADARQKIGEMSRQVRIVGLCGEATAQRRLLSGKIAALCENDRARHPGVARAGIERQRAGRLPRGLRLHR